MGDLFKNIKTRKLFLSESEPGQSKLETKCPKNGNRIGRRNRNLPV
jgi:hypothetical protein